MMRVDYGGLWLNNTLKVLIFRYPSIYVVNFTGRNYLTGDEAHPDIFNDINHIFGKTHHTVLCCIPDDGFLEAPHIFT